MLPEVLPITREPSLIKCSVNSKDITFEIDSGSHISTIKHADVIKVGGVIQPTRRRVVGYSGNAIELCGEAHLKFECNGERFCHNFLVVKSSSVNLFGRDLCLKVGCCFKFSKMENNGIKLVDREVLHKFRSYISDDFKSCVKQSVKLNVLPNAFPVFAKARSVPVRMRENVEAELRRLEESGTITKVFSSKWASPTVNVIKTNGSIRICGDFSSTVNKYLKSVQSPLPSIDEVIARVGTSSVFSKIDLSNAFLQLPLDEDSKEYTTINTCAGLFRYNYLPFGLTASSGIFQAYMTKILNGIDNVIVYQDDILLFSQSVKDHNNILNTVLLTLQTAGIKINCKKCSFFVDNVHYLGYIFDKNGVHPNSDRVRAILEAPSPKDIKQLQAFIGLCNYYNRFIPKFSIVFAPLYALLKKNTKFVWGENQEKCLNVIKDLFASNRLLNYFNPACETLLETDSSGYGIAAVLMQRKHPSDDWLPVQFTSRTLNDSERNYSNIEREALSVVFGCEKFHKFLLGGKFVIHNDQQPLRKLFAHDKSVPSNCSARIQRWALKLSQYDYVFKYSKGVNNVNSDCLSRLPLPETSHECEPYELIFALKYLDKMPVNSNDIKCKTEDDKNLCKLKNHIRYGIAIDNKDTNLAEYKRYLSELTILRGCIIYNNRVLIPDTLRELVLEQLHEGHPGICAMKSLARSLVWYPGIDKDLTLIVNKCSKCQQTRQKSHQNRTLEWPVPTRPWSRVHVDHFFFRDKIFFIAVDALSKYIECEIVPSTSSHDTVEVLRTIFSRNGLCDLIVSDNATSFRSEEFEYFLNRHSIDHITSAPYSPSSNGQAERGVRVIKDLLKKNYVSGSLKVVLSQVLLYYRTVPHSVTNIPPCVALNNRKFVTLKDRVNPKYCSLNSSTKYKNIPNFNVGDEVLAINFRNGPKWYKATIMQKLAANVFNVHIHDLNVVWKRHSNQLLNSISCNENNRSFNHFEDIVPNECYNDCSPISRSDDSKPVSVDTSPGGSQPVLSPPGVLIDSDHLTPNNHVPAPQSTVNENVSSPSLRRSSRIRKPPVRLGI